MSKELCLKKAYDAATVNGVVRRGDAKTATTVIKLGMLEYAKKHSVDIPESEIVDYISDKQVEIEKATADFKISTKIMMN